MSRAAMCAAAALAVSVPLYASAQPAPPLIPDWPQTQAAERDPAVRSLYVLAVCIRHDRTERARALLELAPGSFAEANERPRVIPQTTECRIGEYVRVRQFDLLRGAIAEAIYNFARTRPRGNAALPLDATYVSWREGEVARGARMSSDQELNRWVAHCAVHRAPQPAHTLISQIPGSVRERDALNALRPAFTACMPEGRRLTASRLMIRVQVAEALYHAARANPGAFVSGR